MSTRTLLATYQGISSLSAHTVPVDIPGTTKRKLAIIVCAESSQTIDSATFNAGSCTEIPGASIIYTAGQQRIKSFYIDVADALAAGTYNVVANFSASTTNCDIFVYLMSDCVLGAPEDADAIEWGTASTNGTGTVTATDGSVLIGAAVTSATTQTWSVTGDVSESPEGAELDNTNFTSVAASGLSAGDGSKSMTGTVSSSGTGTKVLVLMSFTAVLGPTITTQPDSQIVEVGSDATFSAEATDADSQQWQENIAGTPTNITGETGTSLVIDNVQLADDGREFRIGFTNTDGTTYSDWATLAVGEIDVASTLGPSDVTGDANTLMTSTIAYDTVPGKFGTLTLEIDGTSFIDYFLPETP